MINEPPAHLADKYRLYAIWTEGGYGDRPTQTLMKIHVGRPMSFRSLCDSFIFENLELTIEKTKEKIPVGIICGIQKIPNDNRPDYELCYGGILREISR